MGHNSLEVVKKRETIMKYNKLIYFFILVFTTIVGIWAIPSLVRKSTYTPDDYPFVYYSSVLKELCFVDYKNKQKPLSDMSGNTYNSAEFDSLMPLLNYRQLMADGRLPDSIDGHEITPQILRVKSVVFKYAPRDVNTPFSGLYILFESMPKRVGLEVPDDVFRLKDNIEFIDAQTNSVNIVKSKIFQEALTKEGFAFPSKWAVGNPNPRKPYDEGYFCLDSAGKLFHLKMVNGRPFVKNTNIDMDIAYFSMLEVPDKRFYGFLFSREGDVYIVEGDDGKYNPIKLDIPSINLEQDDLMIMGNLLYWTVSVSSPTGRNYYALHTDNLKRIVDYRIDRTSNKWDKVSKWVFPFYLTFEDSKSAYVKPCIHFTGFYAFGANILLAIIWCFIANFRAKRIYGMLYILLTGIAGLVSLLILPRFRNKFK